MSSTFHVSTPLRPYRPPEPESADVVKIGVTPDLARLMIAPSLKEELRLRSDYFKLDQSRELEEAIYEICTKFKLPMAETRQQAAKHYAMKFDGAAGEFVTDSNRHTVRHGSILQLASSPSQCTIVYLLQLDNTAIESELQDVLAAIRPMTTDVAFATEFIGQGGITRMIDMLRQDSW